MAENVTVAVIQCPLGDSVDENVERVASHLQGAAAMGANVILPPELFEGRTSAASKTTRSSPARAPSRVTPPSRSSRRWRRSSAW
ncbi:MAG: hypothetical protein R3A52_23580 [Polyangiales bacterium]